jgi:hypothetical protein
MKVVTVKIPELLESKLRKVAARRKESFSELARRALQREVEADTPAFATLAVPYRGMFRAPPRICLPARDMEVRTIVDAGPLIGWLNADDQWA